MKAWAVVRNGEPLQEIEAPDPEPQGTEVVLAVTHAGICHSDLHFWKGEYNMGGGKTMRLSERGVTLPRAPGHEIVGRVLKLGPLASGVAVGDLRIVFPWLGCGVCARCLHGESNLCDKPAAIGVMHHGGFAEQVRVPHSRYLVDPGSVDPAFAATLACSGITVYSAIKKIMPIPADEPVVLIGAGGLGLAAIAMLKALGHRSIISVDTNAEQRAAALAMGASQAVDSSTNDVAAQLMQATGGPVMAVIDFVNISATAQLGLDSLSKDGKLILIGITGGEITISLAGMVFKPRAVQGSATGNLEDLKAVVGMAQAGQLSPIPLKLLPKSEANSAMGMLEKGQVRGRVVLTAA